MDDWNLPWEGGCRCGRVRFSVSAAPLITMACHCKGCQRMTASAFSLSMAIPGLGFTVTRGETAIGALHGPTRHCYCHWCMSWLFSRWSRTDAFVNVRATMLDDASWFTPFIETGAAEKLAWAVTPATHSFEGFPADAAFPGLIEAYAAQVAAARAR